MVKSLLISVFIAAWIASPIESTTATVAAQSEVPAAQTQPPQPSPKNVQLDVVITDTISGKPETKRTTLVVRQGRSGSIRTQGHVVATSTESMLVRNGDELKPFQQRVNVPVELALDGHVQVLEGGLVDVVVTFDYAAPPQSITADGAGSGASTPAKVTESISAVLRSGSQLLVSRSADPVTNRTVTVELTATIREP